MTGTDQQTTASLKISDSSFPRDALKAKLNRYLSLRLFDTLDAAI
jgi:hypothetical protein